MQASKAISESPIVTTPQNQNDHSVNMHNVDIDIVEMSLDVIKFAINRITETDPALGFPKKAEDLESLVGETITSKGIGGEKAFRLFRDVLLKSSISIDHPRHLAFVPASPTRAAIMFDLVTSASSIHGAYWMEGAGGIFAENQAMKWLVELTGMPAPAFGVFTSGGTEANLSAMVAARENWRSLSDDRRNMRGLVIASDGAHSSVKAMARVIDADIRLVATDGRFTSEGLQCEIDSLSSDDRARLFAVIATAGTTNAGIIDDLAGIAAVCKTESVWFHVDAAYGGGALASPKMRPLFQGIGRADSVTIDPHKWLFAPFDCGAVLYKDTEAAKRAHSQEGSYLDILKGEGNGFNPSDYQIQLTRRLRGLPLWFSLATHGTDRYAAAVERGVELARIAGEIITESSHVELVREPSLSCVLYRRLGWKPDDYSNWTYANHKKGFALVAPTKWRNGGEYETVSRFCFINPDTTEKDIRDIIDTMK
jgi:glutamate/tyrosine decarboxylase-like PLP-dependent enzyme